MAIIKEFYNTRDDGVKLYKTYSNEKYKIKKVGTEEVYDEAIDVENSTFEYEETIELIEGNDEIGLKAQAYDILIGEAE